jgi:Sulfotransferase domain
LIHDFPDARVILTTRDEEEWFESFGQTILRVLRGGWLPGNVAEMFSGQRDTGQLADVSVRMSREVMIPLSFAGTVAERGHVIECYVRHNAAVRGEVPAGRLLEFHVRQGWEPLCAFLEVPVPQHPFPHVNDRVTLTG